MKKECEIIIPLIPNDEYDAIKYIGNENVDKISKELSQTLKLINSILLVNANKKESKILEIHDFSNADFLKKYFVSTNLKKIYKKYSIEEISNFFNDTQTPFQIKEIFEILENEKIKSNAGGYLSLKKLKNSSSVCGDIVTKLYSKKDNLPIDNPDYATLYEMKKKNIDILINNIRFYNFAQEHLLEAVKILYLFLNMKIVTESSSDSDIYKDVIFIENMVKSYPENSANAILFFSRKGSKMLEIYKELYRYINYYSQTGADLDYKIALNLTKECFKNNITDVEILKNKLDYIESKILNKIITKKNMLND